MIYAHCVFVHVYAGVRACAIATGHACVHMYAHVYVRAWNHADVRACMSVMWTAFHIVGLQRAVL